MVWMLFPQKKVTQIFNVLISQFWKKKNSNKKSMPSLFENIYAET